MDEKAAFLHGRDNFLSQTQEAPSQSETTLPQCQVPSLALSVEQTGGLPQRTGGAEVRLCSTNGCPLKDRVFGNKLCAENSCVTVE